MNKKLIIGIIGLVLGSVSVYAGTKFYASDVSVSVPTGSNLGSNATLQSALDELYSIADKYDELNKKINILKSEVINEIYPVGSIYISTSITTSSDVAAKFGGTWEAYGSGRTIIGAGTGTDSNNLSQTFKEGSTGGEYKHTLTVNEMPSHTHTSKKLILWTDNSKAVNETAVANGVPNRSGWLPLNQVLNNTGGSQSHNNIQPYITVYMYKRIK